MEGRKAPTIHDVARQAGVSLSTVSRVLNDPDSVSPPTREKVEIAITDLNYEKLRSDNLKPSQESRMVGLIIPDLLNPFFPLLIKGIEQVSKIHDYSLILCDSEDEATIEQQHLSTLLKRGVDGIILIPCSPTTSLEKFVRQGFPPVVFLDRYLQLENASYVTSDNEEGAYQAVKYLLKLGHQRIVILSGPADLSTEAARLQGVQKALAEENLVCNDELCVVGNYHTDDAYRAVFNVLEKQTDFTAIFATNDMMAFGAQKALEEHGFRVPDDISLVGYDDVLFSSILSLTSVAQPTYEMGRNAMVLLLDLINERVTTPQHIVLRPSMVIRGSCKRRQ